MFGTDATALPADKLICGTLLSYDGEKAAVTRH